MRFNYGKPVGYTFFTQGDPGPHVSLERFLAILDEWPNERLVGFNPMPYVHFFGNHPVIPVEHEAGGDDAKNDVAGLWRELFACPPPENMMFLPGATFAIPYGVMKSRSQRFYAWAEYLAMNRPRGPWEFERIWAHLWNPKYKERS